MFCFLVDPIKLDKTLYASAFDNEHGDSTLESEEQKYPSRIVLDDMKSSLNETITRSPKVANKKKEKKVPKTAPVFDINGKIHKVM